MDRSGYRQRIAALVLTLICGAAFAVNLEQLEPLPEPDLSTYEDVIRSRLEALQDRVRHLQSDGADTELAEAHGNLAKHYLAHNLYEAARAAFANARALAPEDLRWTYYLAHVQERIGEHDTAVRLYEQVLVIEPGNIPTLLHLGEVLLEMGEDEGAYEIFKRAKDLKPEEAASHAGIGRAAAALGKPGEAAEHLRRALELQPQATALHYQLALAYRNLGKVDEARSELELRGETPVRYLDPLLNEIGPLQRGDLIEAVLEMAENREEIADRALADFAVGHLGDDPDAPNKLLSAISVSEKEKEKNDPALLARLHYVVAGLFFTRGDLSRSETEINAALSLVPDFIEAALLNGHIHEQLNDLEGAVSVYTLILEAHPDNTEALRYRGRARIVLNDLSGAIEDYRHLSELEPESSGHWIQLAVAQAQLGEFDTARTSYLKALDLGLGPAEAAQAHHHLGLIEGRAGSTDRAVNEFRKAVELDPALVDAAVDLGTALGLLGRYTEAAAAYQLALDEDPSNLEAWLGEATALNLGGSPQQAIEVLENGWQENPSNVELLHALARLLASADDPEARDGDRALDLARRTFRAGSTVDRLETLAMAYAEAGRFSEAIETQKKAISQAGWQGLTNLVPTLEANLTFYEAGQSCCAEHGVVE